MITDDKDHIGIVIESYNHDPLHRVVTVQLPEGNNYFFFYVQEHSGIEFGDTLLMNFYLDKFHLRRGNDRLTYKITPLPFPGDLLLELISERMNS